MAIWTAEDRDDNNVLSALAGDLVPGLLIQHTEFMFKFNGIQFIMLLALSGVWPSAQTSPRLLFGALSNCEEMQQGSNARATTLEFLAETLAIIYNCETCRIAASSIDTILQGAVTVFSVRPAIWTLPPSTGMLTLDIQRLFNQDLTLRIRKVLVYVKAASPIFEGHTDLTLELHNCFVAHGSPFGESVQIETLVFLGRGGERETPIALNFVENDDDQ
jgi:hypothetical protein